MSNEAFITLTGTAGNDAELRFLPNGTAVANVSVAVTPREKKNEQWVDGETAWYRVAAWREMAENVAESVRKGDRVTVVGRLKTRSFEQNGATRMSLEVDADSVALDLRFRTAAAGPKPQRGQGGGQSQQSGGWGGNDSAAPF